MFGYVGGGPLAFVDLKGLFVDNPTCSYFKQRIGRCKGDEYDDSDEGWNRWKDNFLKKEKEKICVAARRGFDAAKTLCGGFFQQCRSFAQMASRSTIYDYVCDIMQSECLVIAKNCNKSACYGGGSSDGTAS